MSAAMTPSGAIQRDPWALEKMIAKRLTRAEALAAAARDIASEIDTRLGLGSPPSMEDLRMWKRIVEDALDVALVAERDLDDTGERLPLDELVRSVECDKCGVPLGQGQCSHGPFGAPGMVGG